MNWGSVSQGQGWGGKTSYFLLLCLNISKTVRDTPTVTSSD